MPNQFILNKPIFPAVKKKERKEKKRKELTRGLNVILAFVAANVLMDM